MIVFILEEEKDGENTMSLLSNLNNSNRIISFGCSLTYGDGLEDSIPYNNSPSSFTYSSLLASRLKKGYTTYAKSGYGNDSIEREIFNYIKNDKKDKDFVVIGWSGIDRKEYFNSLTGNYISLSPNSVESFLKSSLSLDYNKKTLDSFSEIIQSYMTIINYESDSISLRNFHQTYFYVSSVLKRFSIPYLMVSAMDHRIFEIQEITQDKNFYSCDALMQYAYRVSETENRILPCGHPDKKTHKEWTDKIIKWAENE